MRVMYNDGSELECYEIIFEDGEIICDDIYTVPIEDIDRVEADNDIGHIVTHKTKYATGWTII